MVIIFGTRNQEIGRCGMAKKLALILVGILVLTLVSVSLLAEEPVKFKLIVTDEGNWVLRWVQAISVFPFDPVKEARGEEARGEEAIAKIDSPSDPTTFSLAPGNYEVVISVLKYGREPMEISLGHLKLSADTVIDLLEAEIPFELFLPC